MALPNSSLIGMDSTDALVAHDDTGGATPVNRRSDQFQEIHYKLEMALAHADVKVTHLQVWDVRNPSLVARFDQNLRRCPGQPPVDSWIDVDGLDAHNSEEQISKRGFQLRPGASSMSFSTGQVNIAKPPDDGRSSGLNRFLFAEVCTGRSYPKVDPNGKNIIPPGYDSLYLYDGDSTENAGAITSTSSSGGNKNKEYHHDYVLTNMAQVSPQFVVHFTVAAVTDSDRARNAKAKEAHHNSQGADVMGDILDLLDRKLHWSQESVRNKFHAINALQSELSQASHEYNKSLDASHQKDERLEACRAQLAQRRAVINEKLTEVQKNSALVEEQLYTMLQDALFQLQDETQRKLNVLLGEELEIRRRVAHIDWSEECISRFRTELGPPDFVHAWRNHRQVRKSLYRYRDVGTSVLDRVYADIRVAGGVQIVTERGPTSIVANETFPVDMNGTNGSGMMNEFRQEVFKTSSPTKQKGESTGVDGVGTNSLATSIRDEIQTGRSRQAPNSYAVAPTVTGLSLPSSSLRPASMMSGGVDNSMGGGGSSSTEGMQGEWSQIMRKDWGLPSPPAARTPGMNPSPQSPMNGGASGAGIMSPSFGAVDAFVASKNNNNDFIGGLGEDGDFKDGRDESNARTPPPSSNDSAPLPLPPPPPSDEPEAERTRPTGPLGRIWDSHSMTSTKVRFSRAHEDTLPLFESDLVRSFRDRTLINVSLPDPNRMVCEPLEIDLSSRSVEDLQLSILEKVQHMADINGSSYEGGLLFIFRSGDYTFGAYTSKVFESFMPDEEHSTHDLRQSHCGSRENFLFSLTHDLKVSV
jgi:hypothetical protein